jgi:hypothetical protein
MSDRSAQAPLFVHALALSLWLLERFPTAAHPLEQRMLRLALDLLECVTLALKGRNRVPLRPGRAPPTSRRLSADRPAPGRTRSGFASVIHCRPVPVAWPFTRLGDRPGRPFPMDWRPRLQPDA